MSSDKHYTMHVISNTHWDREWKKPFQQHRIMLADFFEELIATFEKDKSYKHFHLDSQTIPLEDYAEVYPEKAAKLKTLIKKGKLLVGPWYTDPEMNLICGEAITRNLLLGHRIARQWGKVMKVGYNPMSNGQIAQLPQIYAGFGIDSILFYRGINRDAADIQFWWKAPDDTRALAIQFPEGRGVFWKYAELPVMYDMWAGQPDTWRCDFDKGGLPFRFGH